MEKSLLKPIGFIKNNIKKPRFGNFSNKVSEIILDKKFEEGLNGIEAYSHLIIVYIMDMVNGYDVMHRPQGNQNVPIVGIFACRCPRRPNPIGVTTVRLISHKENKLKILGLDTINNTPVLDIKPYWPQYDKVRNEKIPKWVNKLKF